VPESYVTHVGDLNGRLGSPEPRKEKGEQPPPPPQAIFSLEQFRTTEAKAWASFNINILCFGESGPRAINKELTPAVQHEILPYFFGDFRSR
jgi:hypothetical protein